MRARVRSRDPADRRIGENNRAVAGGDVTAVETLADEQGLVVRVHVLGRIELEEAAVVARKHDRNAADVYHAVGGHPERRVRSSDEKLGARRWYGRRCRRSAGAGGDGTQ